MRQRILSLWSPFLILLFLFPNTGIIHQVEEAQPVLIAAQSSEVTAYDLIIAMNTLRVSNGLPALVEDPIIDAVAQSTAEIMAANQMSWHIGDVPGRIAAAGYGGGSKVWATENFAVGNMSIDEIMIVWSDASHMIPAVNPAYCNVGAGIARSSNGLTYYVLQAAYVAGGSCGEYKSPAGNTLPPGGSTGGVSQLIVPVKIATPGADGRVFHVVEAGQSFWSIAVAYKITIRDLEIWNNLSRDSKLQIGQRLFIPTANTEGYATPTPAGWIKVSTPDLDGKVIHVIEPYQNLSTISQAYQVSIEKILNLNGWQIDWPLQIGQKLLIDPGFVTPTATPRPLTAIERLTPESDGKYYHIVKSGENLSWIASYYQITVTELMAWNGLNDLSILFPEQKLVLQVTPPATETLTPGPATATFTATLAPPTPSPSIRPTQAITSTISKPDPQPAPGSMAMVRWITVPLAAFGLVLLVFFYRRRK